MWLTNLHQSLEVGQYWDYVMLLSLPWGWSEFLTPSPFHCEWQLSYQLSGWWRVGGQWRCWSDLPWPCPEPPELSSHSLCPEQRWLRPGGGSWGSSPEHGQWQFAASVPQTTGFLYYLHWCCSPVDRNERKWTVIVRERRRGRERESQWTVIVRERRRERESRPEAETR